MVRGHASRLIFENVNAVMAVLVLFEQFLRQILLNYFYPLPKANFAKFFSPLI